MATPDLHRVPPTCPNWGSVTMRNSNSAAVALGLQIMCSSDNTKSNGRQVWGVQQEAGLCDSFLHLKHRLPDSGQLQQNPCAMSYVLSSQLAQLFVPLALLECPPSLCSSCQRKRLLPPASSSRRAELATSSQLQDFVHAHASFPPFSPPPCSRLPTFRCFRVQVSKACLCIRQGIFC